MDFIEHLGTRADLPLRALTSKDVRSFRDAEIKTGKSPVTVNLTHKTIAGAFICCRAPRVHSEQSRRRYRLPANP